MTEDYNQILRDYLNNPLAPEIYKLWYEYLKKNRYYRLFCEVGRKKQPLNIQKELLQCDYYYELFIVFLYWEDIYDNVSGEDIRCKICRKIKENEYGFPLFRSPKKIKKISGSYNVDDLLQFSKEPSLDQLVHCVNYTIPQNYLFLAVPIDPFIKVDELIKQFRKLIKEEKKRFPSQKVYPLFPKPSSNKKFGEDLLECLSRYLKTYKEKEKNPKITWGDLTNKMKIHFDERQTIRDYDNAIEIIENVGKNIFPGDYGKSKVEKEKGDN